MIGAEGGHHSTTEVHTEFMYSGGEVFTFTIDTTIVCFDPVVE